MILKQALPCTNLVSVNHRQSMRHYSAKMHSRVRLLEEDFGIRISARQMGRKETRGAEGAEVL